MKCIIIAALGFCLLSCQEEGDKATPIIREVSALRNGAPWNNSIIYLGLRDVCNPQELGFSVVHRNEYNVIRERLSVNGLSTVSRGLYAVIPSDSTDVNLCDDPPHVALNFLQADGDVGAGGAPLIASADNWVEITEYDTIKQEVWGRFQFTFYDTLYRDTIRLTDGQFHATVVPDTRGEPD
jgi:hypothetical protein